MEKLKSPKTHQNPLFEKGSSVEVRSTDPGFDGSWYEATILEIPRQMRYRYVVEYKTLLSAPSSKRSKREKASSLLKEKVCMSLIRPSSPCKRDRNAVFEAFQEVEAYHNDGWWPGVVLKKMDETGDDGSSNYSVAFPLSREVFPFRAYDLRNKMVWVADDQGCSWKSADQLCNDDLNSEEKMYKATFHVGTRVEVSYDKDNYGACWFVATILQIIGRTYCLVEYDTLKANNNDSTNPSLEEVVDMQYIRPCPPMNMSEPNRSFKELDKVEASYNSGWFLGAVSTVLPNSMYMVRVPGPDKDAVVSFARDALRIPLVWEDGQWDEVSQDAEVVHRSKGQKFKRPKARDTDTLTDDQIPLKKLKKLKDCLIGDKSHHKSSPPHDNGETLPVNNAAASPEDRLKSRKVHDDSTSALKESSQVNNTVPSSGDHLKSREVHRDPTSDLKDENARVNNTVPSSENITKSKNAHHDSTSNHKDENAQVNNPVPSSEKRSITRRAHRDSTSNHKEENPLVNNAAPSEKSSKSRKARRDSTPNHKSAQSDKEGNSLVNKPVRSSSRHAKFSPNSQKNTALPEAKNLLSTTTDVCQENTTTVIDSVTENAEIFKDIIDLEIVEVDDGIQNGIISDKNNKENAMENEHALSKSLSSNENITPLVRCSSSNNTESLDSETEITELMESTKEVLKMFPQNPHCDPLLTHAKFVQKGLAYGLKIAFAELVNSIKKLSTDAADEEFNERFKTLDYVEEFGFSVEQVRGRLKMLKEMRDCLMKLEDKKALALVKAEEMKNEQQMKASEVLDIDKRIASLNEERGKLMSEKAKVESEVEGLNNAAVAVEEECVFVKKKFDEIAKSSW